MYDDVSLRDYIEAILSQRDRLLDERFAAQEHATELKAEELARRLEVLNHAHELAREKERDFISRETYETFVVRYQEAHTAIEREIITSNNALQHRMDAAFERVDEKFADYIKRYEARQRDVDLLLAAQKGAADEAKRAVEDQGRKSNRNLGLASFGLGVVVFLANVIPLLIK